VGWLPALLPIPRASSKLAVTSLFFLGLEGATKDESKWKDFECEVGGVVVHSVLASCWLKHWYSFALRTSKPIRCVNPTDCAVSLLSQRRRAPPDVLLDVKGGRCPDAECCAGLGMRIG